MDLNQALVDELNHLALHPELKKVLSYALLPAGKLFRPRLVQAMSLDLNQSLNPNQLLLALSLELHHTYTLIHDDLPCMDNDDMRRGRPSTHKQFNEWKALLGGDALLIASFSLLGKMKSAQTPELIKFYSWCTGAKGLVLGQFIDLSLESQKSFSGLMRMHELKTARLMQIATVGSYLLGPHKKTLQDFKTQLRLGSCLGIYFQLWDDLDDLATDSIHEKDINPIALFPHEAFQKLHRVSQEIHSILTKNKFTHVEKMVMDFHQASKQNITRHETELTKLLPHFDQWKKEFLT